MTTLAFWSAYDNHGISSIYISTDSRFTYLDSGGNVVKICDNSQKTFLSPLTPDIFGIYGGSVGEFHEIISDVIHELTVLRSMQMKEEYVSSIAKKISYSIKQRNMKSPNGRIVHGFRWVSSVEFTFVEYLIEEINGAVSVNVKPVAIKAHEGFDGSYKKLSELVSFCYERASGADSLYAVKRDDKDISQRGFCRWHWQVFCDHIKNPRDEYTGGAPQLVGLYRKWNGINFGIYFNSLPYIYGKRIDATGLDSIPDQMKWHDELFQRINKYGEIIVDAQRHARITSEPQIEPLIT